MKKFWMAVIGLASLPMTAAAGVDVSIQVGLPWPGVVYGPPPPRVVVMPPPPRVVYLPPPPRVVYVPAPQTYYPPPRVVVRPPHGAYAPVPVAWGPPHLHYPVHAAPPAFWGWRDGGYHRAPRGRGDDRGRGGRHHDRDDD